MTTTATEMAAKECTELDPVKFIEDPFTAQLVAVDSIDSLWEARERAKQIATLASQFERQCRERLFSFVDTSKEGKTHRLRGKRYRLKVELADNKWDQTILKEAYNSYPQFRGTGKKPLLKIGEISISMTEYKKLIKEGGTDPAFKQFKQMICSADRGIEGLPTITQESEAATDAVDGEGTGETATNVPNLEDF